MASAPKEAGAILLANHGGPNCLLIDEIRVATPADYVVQEAHRLEFAPSFLASAVKAARDRCQSLILVHTHPECVDPEFSVVDDDGEALLIPAISARAQTGVHGALVVGKSGFKARVYVDEKPEPVEKVIEVGSRVFAYVREGAAGSVAEIFDRNVRALGQSGQRVLGRTRVGIVGLGGTGSIVAEQLAYLGVRSFVLIDNDPLAATNLNRVVGTVPDDVGVQKVVCCQRHIDRISAGHATVDAIVGSVLDQSVARHLLDCDAVFNCTDTHASRAIVNQLSYQYFIPAIDLGVRIDAQDGEISAMAGRVQMLAPELACLQCQALLDPEIVRRELLSEDARRADPYIVGEDVPQPSVISLNGTIASLAVTTFLGAWIGLPIQGRRLNYRIREGLVRGVSSQPNPDCIVCSKSRGAFGKGESWPVFWRPE